MFSFLKTKTTGALTPNQIREEAGLEKIEEVPQMNMQEELIDIVNNLMTKLVEHEFVAISPLDGSPISAIRSEDVMGVLCEYYKVDGKKTDFSDYAR